jgi:hypothetical protein
MTLEDLIVWLLASALIPLGLFIFYYTTEPVPGRWWRKPSRIWASTPLGRVLLAQKINLFALISFILAVRWTGGFPGREWVAFGLYAALVGLFWTVFIVLRHIQRNPPKE